MSEEYHSPSDTPIELDLGNNITPIPGTILRCEPDNFVEIALDHYIGKYIYKAKLISRLDFIWKAVEKRLSNLPEIENLDILKKFLNPNSEIIFNNQLDDYWGEEGYIPDEEQRESIILALGRKIHFVHGPPGTGKSLTIGWLAKELIRRGERLIITSHTNIAVDNALTQICKMPEGKTLSMEGEIVRLGEPIDRGLDNLRIQNIIQNKSKYYQQEIASLRQKLSMTESNLDSLNEAINIFESNKPTYEERAKLEDELKVISLKLERVASEETLTKNRLKSLEERLNSKKTIDILFWLFLKFQRDSKAKVIGLLENEIKSRETQKEKICQRLGSLDGILRGKNIPTEYGVYISKLEKLKFEKYKLLPIVEDLKTEIDVIQKKLDEIAQNILKDIKVIGATLSKICLDSSIAKYQPENLIVDELSSAPFPFVLVALSLPTKRAILFGDPEQLPPISLSTTQCAKNYLQRDTYEILDIKNKDYISTQLRNQHRMPISIVEFVNNPVYDGILITDPKTDEDRIRILDSEDSPFKHNPFKDHQVILVDTSSLNPWSALDENKSRYNLYSAQIVSEIIAQEIGLEKEWKDKKVGIICPFRAQKQLIKQLCQVRLGVSKLPDYLDVHTVDSFQGEQRDVIILDLTAGQPSKPGIRLSENFEREKIGPRKRTKVRRLFNVAITRTKYHLIIIANKKYFEREFRNYKDEFVLEIINRASGENVENGLRNYYAWIDGEDFLREQIQMPVGFSVFLSESDFYQYLKKDFKIAKKSVIIVSPYFTQNRIQDLIPNIINMLQRGVRVHIITRPIEEADFGVNALKSLQQRGCTIEQRKKTHEKIVFIDNNIAYYGSLNVLSHKDTKEVMHRIEGESITQLLRQFIGVISYSHPSPSEMKIDAMTGDRLTREECVRKFKNLRFKIASQRHIPAHSVLYNNTIEELLNHLPKTEKSLFEILKVSGEKQMKHLSPFLDEILDILQRHSK